MLSSAIGFVTGMVFGSFAKAVAERLLKDKSVWGRSYCPRCKHVLGWYDLFPVFSYIFLKGRCRYCQKPIAPSNFITEVVLGLIMALVFYQNLPNPEILLNQTWEGYLALFNIILGIIIMTVLTMVVITDLEEGLILDKVIFPASILVGVYLIITSALKSFLIYDALSHSQLGKYLLPPYTTYFTDQLVKIWLPLLWSILTGLGLAGFFVFLILITKGKGMGWGDVKLVFFLGLALGFPNAILGVFLGFLLGAIYSLVLIAINRKKFGQTIPFGPFLAGGAVVAYFWGTQILNWYLNSLKLGY